MNEELIELYKEGLTHSEIGEELGLAPSTVGQYIYKEKINKDEDIMEKRNRALIKNNIDQYEDRFGLTFNMENSSVSEYKKSLAEQVKSLKINLQDVNVKIPSEYILRHNVALDKVLNLINPNEE